MVRVCVCVPLQALEVIRQLKTHMQIERARMRLKLVLPAREARRVREKISGFLAIVEQEDWDPDLEIVSYPCCNTLLFFHARLHHYPLSASPFSAYFLIPPLILLLRISRIILCEGLTVCLNSSQTISVFLLCSLETCSIYYNS